MHNASLMPPKQPYPKTYNTEYPIGILHKAIKGNPEYILQVTVATRREACIRKGGQKERNRSMEPAVIRTGP